MQLKRNYVQFTSEEPCSYKWKLHADCPEYARENCFDKYALQEITVVMTEGMQSITVVTEDIPVFCQTCCTISSRQCPYIR